MWLLVSVVFARTRYSLVYFLYPVHIDHLRCRLNILVQFSLPWCIRFGDVLLRRGSPNGLRCHPVCSCRREGVESKTEYIYTLRSSKMYLRRRAKPMPAGDSTPLRCCLAYSLSRNFVWPWGALAVRWVMVVHYTVKPRRRRHNQRALRDCN